MKNIKFRFPTSIRDIKILWKEHTSKRYRNNVNVLQKLTDYYIDNTLKGRWQEITTGGMSRWTDGDKHEFEMEMRKKCNEYVNKLIE